MDTNPRLALSRPWLTMNTKYIGSFMKVWVYGIKPEVWGRVGPDPRAELQVDLEYFLREI